MSSYQSGVISIDRGERIYILETDKDTHFTGAIALNAIEYEDIGPPTTLLPYQGLNANKITIRGINVQCTSALAFRFWVFGTDAHADADLDVDSFSDYIELDLATNGERIAGAGQYYYKDTNIRMEYEDEDEDFTLHSGLQIFGGAGKLASPAEYVQIDVSYSPRL